MHHLKEFELENIEPVKNVVNKFIPFEDTEGKMKIYNKKTLFGMN